MHLPEVCLQPSKAKGEILQLKTKQGGRGLSWEAIKQNKKSMQLMIQAAAAVQSKDK